MLATFSLAVGHGTAMAAGISAADEFVARTWTKADGLPQNSITAVLQTHDGFLWVGTPGSLSRFDGVHFLPVNFPGATNLPVAVSDLCEDHVGSLWVGTRQQGLFCLQTNHISHFTKIEGLADDRVTSLAVDGQGKLWIGTRFGLSVWDGVRFNRFGRADGLPDENISSVFVARGGTVWITTQGGVCVWRNGKFQPYAFDTDSTGRSPEFLGVYEDRQKNIWAYGDTYLVNLADSLGNRLNNFRRGDLSSTRLWSFCEDREGRLWVGTSGQGMLQFTGDSYGPFRPIRVRNGKMPNDVRSICEDREGNLWLGAEDGGLVQLRQERIRQFGAAEGLPAGPATCVAEDSVHHLWAVFANGGLFWGNGDRFESATGLLSADFVHSLAPDYSGNVWIGLAGFGVDCWHDQHMAQFTSANGLGDEFITAVCADGKTIYAGSRSGHVFALHDNRWQATARVNGSVSALLAPGTNRLFIATASGTVSLATSNNISPVITTNLTAGARISGLCLDDMNRLWASTEGSGLVCSADHFLKAWTTADGLPDNQIFSLVFDFEDNLWLTTAKGLCRVDRTQLNAAAINGRFSSITVVQPFANAEMATTGWPGSLCGHDGLLWFATGRGLIRLDPRERHAPAEAPPVYIEAVTLNGTPLAGLDRLVSTRDGNPPHPLKLSTQVRSFDFDFTAPCLTSPEKAVFRYRLEGFDEDWIDADSANRHVHYGAISSGKYCFHVIACDANGVWNTTGASFAFVVPPPWWRSPITIVAFFCCSAFLIAAAVRFISHRRLQKRLLALEQSQAMARERMRIAQDMHDEIGSKLAKISFLSEDVKHTVSPDAPHAPQVDSIASTSRDLLQSLDQMVWAVNPRNDSLEQLVAYLGQYAGEYFSSTSIKCELRLPGQFPDVPLSAEVRHNVLLAFEESLGNAMKHSGAKIVRVEMRYQDGWLEISVTDNGTGFNVDKAATENHAAGGRQGLSGMQRRLHDTGGRCELRSAAGTGTTVLFRIPISPTAKKL